MSVPTCVVILDAGRRDYFTPDRAPFLASLVPRALSGAVESPPGFAQRTTMFTGTHPDTSQNFSAFGYNPDASPFRWVRRLGPLRSLYQPRRVLFPARIAIKHLTRWITHAYHTDPAWIPARFLPFFEIVEDARPVFDPGALPHTSIFDLLREHGKEFRYLAHPVSGNDDETLRRALHAYRPGSDVPSLLVVQFSALDEGGHRDGPLLPPDWAPADDQTDDGRTRMAARIADVDRRVRDIDAAMEARVGAHHLLVLGDHGMAPVRRRVNMLAALDATDLRAGADYVLFLDSTFAKFWFHNERAERLIRDLLPTLSCGRILDDAERRRLRIHFQHRRYGDLMFAADPGVLFWPDYFHVTDSVIRGMHGYVDKREETYGFLLLHGPSVELPRDLGIRNLVDVFGTLCDLTGVPTPAHNEGESLLRERAVEVPVTGGPQAIK